MSPGSDGNGAELAKKILVSSLSLTHNPHQHFWFGKPIVSGHVFELTVSLS